MKVLLGFAAQFIGIAETTVDIPPDSSEEYIKSLFDKELGLPYDDNCYYEILDDKECKDFRSRLIGGEI